jgi:hypothetical protein
MNRLAGIMVVMACITVFAGCDQLRFAPGEAMKANAWAHYRTTQLAADAAREQNASQELCGLTELSAQQSAAFVGDYGMPKELPAVETPQEALSEANQRLATAAMDEASQRPDPWQAADVLLQAGLTAAGVLGGVSGARIARALQKARDVNRAAREIILGNEVFKRNNRDSAEAFKQAQQGQSIETKKFVTEIKAES